MAQLSKVTCGQPGSIHELSYSGSLLHLPSLPAPVRCLRRKGRSWSSAVHVGCSDTTFGHSHDLVTSCSSSHFKPSADAGYSRASGLQCRRQHRPLQLVSILRSHVTRASPPLGVQEAKKEDDVFPELGNESEPDEGVEFLSSEADPGALFDMVKTSADSRFRIDYLGESTKGDLLVRADDPPDNEGVPQLGLRPLKELAREGTRAAEELLLRLGLSDCPTHVGQRGIFCTRTMNLRSITTVGYDMDYTLIHYNVNAWEGRAYEYGMENLRMKGYPIKGLHFDPDLVIRGLIVDKERGNLVKADRFGYVRRAMHGTQMLSNQAISETYGRELVDLRQEGRWEFLNTLFSVSEAVMYMQMVERKDAGLLPPDAPSNYRGLYEVVARALFSAHVEGRLKDEIMAAPDKFVELDPEAPRALLDQREAGKRLLLITNSDYHYTRQMMQHSFDRFLPDGMTWRDLFDVVVVSARKPDFFQRPNPMYEIVTEDGLMRPAFTVKTGGIYCGGSAAQIERALGIGGAETMYVGDHIYTDVSQAKQHLRWRTCLVVREIEAEVEALSEGREHRSALAELMEQKARAGEVFNQLRLASQRKSQARPQQSPALEALPDKDLAENMQKLLLLMEMLDQRIGPMLAVDGEHFNSRWGYLSRAGLNDKSHLTRQIEKYADIYTSRVSNFLRSTPFMYFRSCSQSLGHDQTWKR